MAFEDGVFATFYDDALKNEFKSKKVGYAVFDDVLMIKIQVPNQIDCVPRPAQEKDKERFPKSWNAYVTGKEEVEEGFPLAQWPQMTAGELKVCQANQIKTVEQLAEVSDATIHRLGQGGVGMKQRAIKFLKSLGETDALRARVKELESKIAALENSTSSTTVTKKKTRKKIKVAS